MSVLNEKAVRSLVERASAPLVFRRFVDNWLICQWDLEKWCSVFGDKEIPFRCMKKDFLSDEPCWERRCIIETKTFKNFIDCMDTCEEWMYFDYKYVHQWFTGDHELYKVTYKNAAIFI